jgi:hypothetical protein
MKVVFQVYFMTTPSYESRGGASLTVDLPFAPTCDIKFGHTVWKKGPRKPLSVIYDLDENLFFVQFEADELESKHFFEQHARMYRAAGWDVTP